VHWRFACDQAFAGLRELVGSFDFQRLADGHTYVGIEPSYLIQLIDGFLSEPDGVVFGGDRADLQRLLKLVIDHIQPAYRQGLAAGRRHWHEGDGVYGSLSTEELHELALKSAPDDGLSQGWFAEGFCFAYSSEELESLRPKVGGESGS
jgi:hypothetical protein